MVLPFSDVTVKRLFSWKQHWNILNKIHQLSGTKCCGVHCCYFMSKKNDVDKSIGKWKHPFVIVRGTQNASVLSSRKIMSSNRNGIGMCMRIPLQMTCLIDNSELCYQKIYLSSAFSTWPAGASMNTFSVSLNSNVDVMSSGTPDGTNNLHGKDIFLDRLHSCGTPGEILDLVGGALYIGSLERSHIAAVFLCYQTSVYDQFTLPWLLPEPQLRKRQLQCSFLDYQFLRPYTTDSKFKHLCMYTEAHVKDLPVRDCLQILHSLNLLFLKPQQSTLADKLHNRCLKNLQFLDLHQLAVLSSCLQSYPGDFVSLGKIANATKIWLTEHLPYDVDLGDLCEVFANIKHTASVDMFDFGAQTIIAKLNHDPNSITLNMLSKVCLFAEISDHECTELLVNGILNFPSTTFQHLNIDNTALSFGVCSAIGKNPWLCPVLHRVRACCASELQHLESMSLQDIVRLILPFDQIPQGMEISSLAQCVLASDNFLLWQLMRHHLQADFIRLPLKGKLLYAYHKRLEKLFKESSPAELTDLLWQDDGEWAEVLFKFLKKMSTAGVYSDGNLPSFLTHQSRLKPEQWDVPKGHIHFGVLHAIDKLRSSLPLTSLDHSTITKLLVKLDFDDWMTLFNTLSGLGTLLEISRGQAKELETRLVELFEDRLCRTHTLTPALTTNKVWLGAKHRKKKENRLFSHLLDNLPRFTEGLGEKNCLRALKILYWSAEKLPAYQEEIFENLISFLMSHPKAHVYPGFQLLKTLSYAGYQPRDNESFEAWVYSLTAEVMDKGSLYKSLQVQMAHYMSMLGIFSDEFLSEIFSIDFLLELEIELKGSTLYRTQIVTTDLALLSRTVAIQCPHLALPWICQNFLPTFRPVEQLSVERMVNSLRRISGKPEVVMAPVQSPYLHHIDALICLDHNNVPMRAMNIDGGSIVSVGFERLALLHLDESHFCHASDKLTGRCQTDIRELQILGYTIIPCSYQDLSSPALDKEGDLDCFVRDKINSAVGFELFPDLAVFSHIFEE